MTEPTENPLAEARAQAIELGIDPQKGADLWAIAYMRGVVDGGTKVAAEICRREGHDRKKITSLGDLALGVERYLCGRCPKSWTVTTVEA